MIAKPLLAAKAGALCNCDVYLFVCLSVCCLKGNGHRVAATNGCPRCFLHPGCPHSLSTREIHACSTGLLMVPINAPDLLMSTCVRMYRCVLHLLRCEWSSALCIRRTRTRTRVMLHVFRVMCYRNCSIV